MRRVLNIMTVCLTASLIAGAAAGLENGARADQELTAMAEDIEIMQRIIDKTLQQHFATMQPQWYLNALGDPTVVIRGKDKGKEPSELAYRYAHRFVALGGVALAQQRRQSEGFDTMGFYVPGVGAVFTLDLQIGTKQVEMPEEARPDLWERTKGELRGVRTDWSALSDEDRPAKRTTIDQEALDRTVAVLIETIGQYGSRMAHLDDNEFIIVAAHVNPQWLWGLWEAPESLFTRSLLSRTYTVVHPGTRNAMHYQVIIKAPMDAVRSLAQNRIDQEAFKSQVKITKYQAPPSGVQTSTTTPAGG